MPQLAAESWVSGFPLVYAEKSSASRDARALKREQARERQAARRAQGHVPSAKDRVMADFRQERGGSLAALVELRVNRGFIWHGGPVAGDVNYPRPAFSFQGLVSPLHPVLALFVTKTRRAAGLVTGDHKAEASPTDSKLLALDSAYVEANKAMRGVLRVELDQIFASPEALTKAIAATGTPLPNLVVGYKDRQGRLHRPHLLWLLANSVCFTEAGHKGHKTLWRKVLGGLTAALLPLGADPGGTSNPLRMKNPLSPLWDRFVLSDCPYGLAEDQRANGEGFAGLAEHLPISQSTEQLKTAKATFTPSLEADHPDPVVAIGSNGLFRHLAAFARQRVGGHKAAGSEAEFAAELAIEAMRLCKSGRAAERSALGLAETVAHWTWRHYRAPATPRTVLSPKQRQARQGAAGKGTATSRRETTLAALIRVAKKLQSRKQKVTQPVVARLSKRSQRTVERHWKTLLKSLQNATNSPSYAPVVDKKKLSCLPDPALTAMAVESDAVVLTALEAAPGPGKSETSLSMVARFDLLLASLGDDGSAVADTQARTDGLQVVPGMATRDGLNSKPGLVVPVSNAATSMGLRSPAVALAEAPSSLSEGAERRGSRPVGALGSTPTVAAYLASAANYGKATDYISRPPLTPEAIAELRIPFDAEPLAVAESDPWPEMAAGHRPGHRPSLVAASSNQGHVTRH